MSYPTEGDGPDLEDSYLASRVRLAPIKSRGGRRRWLGVLGTAVAVYAITVAGLQVISKPRRPPFPTSTSTTLPASVRALNGEVLALATTGTVEAADPDGLGRRPLPNLGTFAFPPVVGVAADQGVFTIANPAAVIRNRPAVAQVSVQVPAGTAPAGPEPFADHDRALVVVGPGGVSLVVLDGSTAIGLGAGDRAAGDPASLGAFVSGDGRLELRQPARSPVVVATAAALDRDVGVSPETAVQFGVYPDPAGDKMAVVLDSGGPADANAPMVVIRRDGRLLGTVGSTIGPTEGTSPAWSPDGRSIAYTTFDALGATLAVWTPGRRPLLRVVPNPGDNLSGCLWSPTGTDVLCTSIFGPGQSNPSGMWGHDTPSGIWGWVLAGATGGPLYAVDAPGAPITWLPGVA